MQFLEVFRALWPVAVVLLPLVTATGFLWLKTQFPTKAELEAVRADVAAKLAGTEKRLSDKLDEHEERLDVGSKKMADLDKRTALVEDECKQAPSRNTLQVELSQMAQRIRGVEVHTQSINDQLATQNTYLHTIIERNMGPRR